MTIQFFWYPKCSTCQRAKTFLAKRGIIFTERDIKQDRPSYEELKILYKKSKLPLAKFFNTNGLSYKALGLKTKLPSMPEEELLQLLAADSMLIKRPILAGENFVLTGFKENEWTQVLENKTREPQCAGK